MFLSLFVFVFFFFNDTATTEIYTLSLHDALPILDPMVKKRAKIAYSPLNKGEYVSTLHLKTEDKYNFEKEEILLVK